MTPLHFPLIGERNRPIYDSSHRLTGIVEHAPLFVAAANFVYELSVMSADGSDDGPMLSVNAIRARATEIMEMERSSVTTSQGTES